MEAALGAVVVEGEGEVVGLVVAGDPAADLLAAVEHDLLGGSEAQHVLQEAPELGDIGGEQVHVVEPARVDAAGRKALRLVLERGGQLRRRLVPFGLVVDLQGWPSGVVKA